METIYDWRCGYWIDAVEVDGEEYFVVSRDGAETSEKTFTSFESADEYVGQRIARMRGLA